MKVLYLTNIPAPYKVEFFDILGEEVELTVLYERKYAANRDKDWKSNIKQSFQSVFLKGIKFGEEDAICFSIFKILQKKEYDFLIISGYSTPTSMMAIAFCKIKGIPYFLSFDGGLCEKDYGIKKIVKKNLICGATGYLCPSKKVKQYVLGLGVTESKIHMFPFSSVKKENVLTHILKETKKEELRQELGIVGKHVILSVGSFIHRKGFDILLEALQYVQTDMEVYLIGGEANEQYWDILKKHNLKNVHFLKFMQYEQLKKYYLAADVFVLPTREDIWGLVINEALANALPVITTDRCGAGLELIEDGLNGYIVKSDQPDELAKKIDEVLQNPVKRAEMSESALQTAISYTLENMAKTHLEILENMLVFAKS